MMMMSELQWNPSKRWLKYELDINVYHFETDYFRLWFLYRSDLRISTVGKGIRILHF